VRKLTSEIAVRALLVAVPAWGVIWAWRRRIRPATTWHDRALLAALIVLTADFLLYSCFWFWPWFGAKPGGGFAVWQRAVTLVQVGFWLSIASLVLALASAGKGARRAVIALCVAAAFFWTMMVVPAVDFRTAESRRQAGSESAR
jgi:hypothetical protein